MAVDYHAIAAATNRGSAQATTDIVSNTNRRDVSEVLDLLAQADTPFINRVGWGSDSGGTQIEWLSEDLGPGWVALSANVATGEASMIIASAGGTITTAEASKQVNTGTMMYMYSSTDGEHALYAAISVFGAGTIGYEPISTAVFTNSSDTSISAGDKFYILGAIANEGSLPRTGQWRARAVRTNDFTILRQDVQITGSQKNTDMYAISREDLHQIRMRMKEMQRDRERSALYSPGVTPRSTTEASLAKGVLGFLLGQSGTHIDTATTTLTPSALNTVVNHLWDYGANSLAFLGDINQCAKFTQWDIDRIRMAPRDGRGGGNVTYWMSEAGIEIEIIPMRQVPTNLAFVLDMSRIQLRAKKNRKAIMEKLGLAGDFEDWQILSEFSLEMRGYDHQQHGLFTALS
jgi:hypothetical protein